jgi:cell division protein ZipA
MEPLRWILLLAGLLLIGAIYVVGRRGERAREEGAAEHTRRPAGADHPPADFASDAELTPEKRVDPDLDLSSFDPDEGQDAAPAAGEANSAEGGATRPAGAAPHRPGQAAAQPRTFARGADTPPSPAVEPDPAAPPEPAIQPEPGPAVSEPDMTPPASAPEDQAFAPGAGAADPGPERHPPASAEAGHEQPVTPDVARHTDDRAPGEPRQPPPAGAAAAESGAQPASEPEPTPDAAAGAGASARTRDGEAAGEQRQPAYTAGLGATDHRPDSPGRAASQAPGAEAEPDADRVIVVYVVAARGQRLVGSQLRAALERHKLRHQDAGIFAAADRDGRTLFKVANVVEPGTFDLATMDTMTTPGVALFMQPEAADAQAGSAEAAFKRMIETARALSDEFKGRLLDSQPSPLTQQSEQHLREEMRLLDHRRRSASR